MFSNVLNRSDCISLAAVTLFLISTEDSPLLSSESLSNVYNLTQSWNESFIGPSGSVNIIHNSQDEFYNGELSGSKILVANGELNDENTFKGPVSSSMPCTCHPLVGLCCCHFHDP